jgi:hypothetical protein
MRVTAGVPVEEIEVTPAMIEAGLNEYDSGGGDFGCDPASWIVRDIYRAMEKARRLEME